ncbi:tRNA (guanosine(37)-N1)-methyltransferase TrmD [Candidatus Chazhemtobacterium aquaticus]|uniref:tRNA (guanine-N(1)-)-methyltransferase n=1 Tax=Candidatus Chazhemtobacterium aquaticus TaxID=2715735 RepID=A0A857N627_9BACT|nr:tRNA (guanosine(37)-N1)-methyltransferase TrmD [Candidatus Chazhemtobacterium aquaticus]QHO63434.1 tRNA (guanine(37)-N(1))-methyltransferase [Candidatus Chazhemtobacterium aquaticus]
MKIDILTIFPEMFVGPFGESIVKRAIDQKQVDIKIHDLREWTEDKHRSVDAPPYGGGAGMVMRVDVIDKAVSSLRSKETKVILLETKGKIYSQNEAVKMSKEKHLILIAGHYEGIDHRVHEEIADEVYSIGEYVLTGGELPVMVVVDSIVRLIPGVLGNPESLSEESYSEPGKREYPQYTRPSEYKGWKVPEVLLEGNHAEIEKWRKEKSGKR